MGLPPEQCVDMAKKYVKESLGAAEGTENTAKLMEYIDKPGAIRPHLQHGKADSR